MTVTRLKKWDYFFRLPAQAVVTSVPGLPLLNLPWHPSPDIVTDRSLIPTAA